MHTSSPADRPPWAWSKLVLLGGVTGQTITSVLSNDSLRN